MAILKQIPFSKYTEKEKDISKALLLTKDIKQCIKDLNKLNLKYPNKYYNIEKDLNNEPYLQILRIVQYKK
jgi:hypothetical protein